MCYFPHAKYFPDHLRHISPIAGQDIRSTVHARVLPAAAGQAPHVANAHLLLNKFFHMQAFRRYSARPQTAQTPISELALDKGGAN
jgi:hypothetical protein